MRISSISNAYPYNKAQNSKQNASFKKLIVSDKFKEDLKYSSLNSQQKEILYIALDKCKDVFDKMDKDATITYQPAEKGPFWKTKAPEKILINFAAKRYFDDYYNTSIDISYKAKENVDSDALADEIKRRVENMQKFVYEETGGKDDNDNDIDDDDYMDLMSDTGHWDLTDAYIP